MQHLQPAAPQSVDPSQHLLSADDKFRHIPSRRATVGGRAGVSAAVPPILAAAGGDTDVMALNARAAAEIEAEIARFESVHPYIYQMYGILEAMSPSVEARQEMFALVTKIEDSFVNSEEWTLSRGAQSLRVGLVGALESGKTSLVHYFLTGNVGAPSSSEGGRFKKCVYVDDRPLLAHIRDEGAAAPEYQFTHWVDGVIIVFSVASRGSYSTALHYFRQMTSYRGLSDVPVLLVGTLDQPLLDGEESGGEEEGALVREVSAEEAHSASVTLKMSDYVECLTYADEVHALFQSVFRHILHRQRLASTVGQPWTVGHHNSSNQSQRYSLNGAGGRVQELNHHHYQPLAVSGPPLSNRKSIGAASYHHQRSISAVPLPPNSGNGRVAPPPPLHHNHYYSGQHNNRHQTTSPQQLSPSADPTPRNAGRSALKRQNFSYCPSRYAGSTSTADYYATLTDSSPNASIRSVYSGSLASVPSAFHSEFIGGAGELLRSDSFAEPMRPPLFRRDANTFGRASERSSCSSFAMPSSSSTTARHNLHHYQLEHSQPHPIMHSNERLSTPEIGRMGSFLDGKAGPATVLGISPAYSHSSLASQFSYPAAGNEVDGPPYSRSSSSVVDSIRAGGVPPPLPPPPPPSSLIASHQPIRNGAFPFAFDDGASVSSLYGGGGGTPLANSLSVANGAGTGSPIVTPNTQRKNRRISSIFRAKDHHHHQSNGHTPDSGSAGGVDLTTGSPSISSLSNKAHSDANGMGVGREIPLREGYLYKKSNKALNREWKKKYVCLYADGIMKYYGSNKDYRNEAKGKSLYVGLATVRLRRPRAAMRNSLLPQPSIVSTAPPSVTESLREVDEPTTAAEYGGASTPGEGGTSGNSDGGLANDLQRASMGGSVIVAGRLHHQDLGSQQQNNGNGKLSADPSPIKSAQKKASGGGLISDAKKKHKRLGGGGKNNEDEEDCEFEIIASDQTHWEFAAPTVEERVEWVRQIEELIEKCLQSQTSQKQQSNAGAHGNKDDVAALRQLPGNDVCADCGQPRPDWASLNLGTLICIECSGIHRNLGSHISRVRSLDLDEWPNEFLCVMQAIGNRKANGVWENSAPSTEKPTPFSSREVKDAWIKRKYEQKAFLAPLRVDCPVGVPLGQCILKAVLARDIEALMRILPRASDEDVNATVEASGVDGKTASLTASGYENNGGGRPVVDRRTAVHLASSYDAADILQLLIWYNADVRALDESGKSALWYARLASSNNCRSILLNAGLEPDYGLSDVSPQSGGTPSNPSTKSGRRDAASAAEFNASETQSRMARLSAEAAEAARHLRHHSGGVVTLRKTYDGGAESPAFDPAGIPPTAARASAMKESIVSML